MKNLKKKIGVVVLSGVLLSGVGLAANSSVASANSSVVNALSSAEQSSAYRELMKAYALDELVDLSKESNLFRVLRSNFDQEHSNFGDIIRYSFGCHVYYMEGDIINTCFLFIIS